MVFLVFNGFRKIQSRSGNFFPKNQETQENHWFCNVSIGATAITTGFAVFLYGRHQKPLVLLCFYLGRHQKHLVSVCFYRGDIQKHTVLLCFYMGDINKLIVLQCVYRGDIKHHALGCVSIRATSNTISFAVFL